MISLYPIIQNASIIGGHSISGDLDYLVKLNIAKDAWLKGINIYDSYILAKMVDENKIEKGAYGLENLFCSKYKFESWKKDTQEFIEAGHVEALSPDQRMTRCRMDAWASGILIRDYLRECKVPPRTIEFTHRIALTLHRMGLAGAAINLSELNSLTNQWKSLSFQSYDLLQKEAFKYGLAGFEPTNDNHIRELLYKKLLLKPPVKTKKTNKPSVAKPSLLKLNHPICNLIVRYNKYNKLASTWAGDKFSEYIDIIDDETGLMHFWLNPSKARTGRRSSGGEEQEGVASRNSQNWPPEARKIVKSRWKKGRIGVVDFSRIEVVNQAWLCKDTKLLDYFLNGDGYIGVAKELFNQVVVPGTLIYKAVKAIVLGVQYNLQKYNMAKHLWDMGFKLSSDFETHIEKTEEKRQLYFAKFPGLKYYINKRLVELAKTQQIVNPIGRIRHLPHGGPATEGYWRLENQAINYNSQSMASDITGSVLIDFEEAMLANYELSYTEWHQMLLKNPLDLPFSVLINEVHDEVDIDLHPDTGDKDLEMLVESARRLHTFRGLLPEFDIIPNVSVKVAESWGG